MLILFFIFLWLCVIKPLSSTRCDLILFMWQTPMAFSLFPFFHHSLCFRSVAIFTPTFMSWCPWGCLQFVLSLWGEAVSGVRGRCPDSFYLCTGCESRGSHLSSHKTLRTDETDREASLRQAGPNGTDVSGTVSVPWDHCLNVCSWWRDQCWTNAFFFYFQFCETNVKIHKDGQFFLF